ncbi:MAG TPA: tetratricopeptide repeat protein, partial [Actinomycetota bacterium]|nr:tetratricopeptide repeat protein [Actinomycetota bacterium]
LLLVLDNFERVMDAAPDVDRLLRAGPELRVLVTSRSPLQLYGEHEFPVPPLSLPDLSHPTDAAQLSQFEAVALFIDRATAVKPGFAVTNDNAPAVAAICAGLDGLPLAIELAASRVKVLPPSAILSRLQDRLSLLRSESRSLPERQRTLRGAIDWSYELLDEAERRLLARLAVFAGGGTFDAIDVVANPDREIVPDTLDALGSLVDKSLLRQAEDPDGEARFSMLETIREYAAERLRTSGEEREIRRRHAEHVASFAERAEPHLEGTEQRTWLDRCEREHDNVRAALAWSLAAGEVEVGLRIAAALWRFWQQRGHLREGRRLLEDLLEQASGDRTEIRAIAEIAAGSVVYWQGDYTAADRHYTNALEISHERGDRRGTMEALFNRAFIPLVTGRFDDARPIFDEALAIARELGDRRVIALASGSIGYLLLRSEPDAAIPMLEEQVTAARELGNQFWEADGIVSIGQSHRFLGDPDSAERRYVEALHLYLEHGNLPMIGATLMFIAFVESMRGRHDRAMRLFAAGDRIMSDAGSTAPPEGMFFVDPEPPARDALGDDAVERALDEGRAMDLDKAVAYALEDGG